MQLQILLHNDGKEGYQSFRARIVTGINDATLEGYGETSREAVKNLREMAKENLLKSSRVYGALEAVNYSTVKVDYFDKAMVNTPLTSHGEIVDEWNKLDVEHKKFVITVRDSGPGSTHKFSGDVVPNYTLLTIRYGFIENTTSEDRYRVTEKYKRLELALLQLFD